MEGRDHVELFLCAARKPHKGPFTMILRRLSTVPDRLSSAERCASEAVRPSGSSAARRPYSRHDHSFLNQNACLNDAIAHGCLVDALSHWAQFSEREEVQI